MLRESGLRTYGRRSTATPRGHATASQAVTAGTQAEMKTQVDSEATEIGSEHSGQYGLEGATHPERKVLAQRAHRIQVGSRANFIEVLHRGKAKVKLDEVTSKPCKRIEGRRAQT